MVETTKACTESEVDHWLIDMHSVREVRSIYKVGLGRILIGWLAMRLSSTGDDVK